MNVIIQKVGNFVSQGYFTNIASQQNIVKSKIVYTLYNDYAVI